MKNNILSNKLIIKKKYHLINYCINLFDNILFKLSILAITQNPHIFI